MFPAGYQARETAARLEGGTSRLYRPGCDDPCASSKRLETALKSQGGGVMRMYIVAAAAGVLVGIIYGILNVRSPAPPVVALVGLFGILVGEQVVPFAKRFIAGHPINIGWVKSECMPHVFGELPTKSAAGIDSNAATTSKKEART
jgi:XapX domain-containing protein